MYVGSVRERQHNGEWVFNISSNKMKKILLNIPRTSSYIC